MFFKGSRYEKVETVRITDRTGVEIAYKKVRFISPPAAEGQHEVSGGDRIDLIAHKYLKDPERFWRICDANRALWPADLIARAGRRIGIPVSEG